jgi:hypothetical protein
VTGWGWVPPAVSPIAPAPSVISLRVGQGLQAAHDELTNGGTIQLGAGTFYGDPSVGFQDFRWTNPNVSIIGVGVGITTIGSPISGEVGYGRLEDVTVRPPAGAYGLRLFRDEAIHGSVNGGVPRWTVKRVYVGAADATGRDGGLGPAKGIWLDGAILGLFEQCTVAFCSDSGFFADTTSPGGVYSTNAHLFLDCTFNGNSRYGVELVGGAAEGFQFIGGNMESNLLGEVSASTMNFVDLIGVDFETGVAVSPQVSFGGCGQCTVERCNFVTSGATKALRAALFSTCNSCRFVRNRATGYTQLDWALFDINCSKCEAHGNSNADGDNRFVGNRGSL